MAALSPAKVRERRKAVFMSTSRPAKLELSRFAGVMFGLVTQLLFLLTLPFLFLFLRDGATTSGHWFIRDVLLALQFAVLHSLLLLPAARTRITRLLASQLYGSLFALATCATLWPMFLYWRAAPIVIWEAR